MKRRCSKIQAKTAAAALFFCLVLLTSPIASYALDYDYLNPEKWNGSSNINSANISKSSAGNSLDGVFKFYRDFENGCIYLYFSIDETSLKSYQDVRISLLVSTQSQVYAFSVDNIGMCDQQNNEQSVFQVCQNFSSYPDTGSGLYIAAVQSDKFENSSVDVSLYINGHRYIIMKGIQMTVRLSGTVTRSDRKGRQSTAASTAKSKAQSNAKQSTTKFKPGQGSSNYAATTVVQGTSAQTLVPQTSDTTLTSSNDITANEQYSSSKVRMSTPAVILLISSAVIALAGLVCLISAAAPSKNRLPENTDDEKEE